MPTKRTRFGILVLVLALAPLLGGTPSRAAVALQSGTEGTTRSWRPEEGNIVVGGQGRTWWTAAGEAWRLAPAGTWGRLPAMDLPVPTTDVRLLTDAVLFTVNGDVWHVAEDRWVRAERFPL